MSKEKDWAASIGMIDWDSTSIVFTKRSLLEFLKYTGTTVDTNYNNIAKLPRYAKFGKISEPDPATDATASAPEVSAVTTSEATTADTNVGFKPTRRVRAPPGGETHDLFNHHVDDDALASAPSERDVTGNPATSASSAPMATEVFAEPTDQPVHTGFRPTRRVREGPGGKDSLFGIL
ncbi:hypothetical protein EUX98_g1227 [Antrodiella citrinella]|uniref:Uncharacterized protein n=1 Tax=Antrodiella citrinella TaxID=2447956 RepID=A0A4S4N246_9APHY|nr:hypothetical protein EUX98_g1227 [Antrodiella citrinella]